MFVFNYEYNLAGTYYYRRSYNINCMGGVLDQKA